MEILKNMQTKSLNSPNRLPIEGLAILFFKALYSWGKAIWTILLFFIIKSKASQELNLYVFILIGAIVLLSIIHSLLYYKNFSFQIKDNAFVLQKGYINKENKSIPLERIQTVNIKQNFIQQMIGVVQLDIDTAGSKGKEISLPALRMSQAKELENILLSKKQDNIETDDILEQTSIIAEKNKTLLSLSVIDLAKIALSDNIFKGGLLVLSFLYGLYIQYGELVSEKYSTEIETAKTSFSAANWKTFTFLFLVFILLSITISIILNILVNFNLKLSLASQGYKIERGLFNKKSMILPINKIQTYTWTTNPLRKLLNIVTISIKQASSEKVKENNAVYIPGCYSDIEENIRTEVFPGYKNQEYSKEKTQSYYFLRFWLLLVFLPSIIIPFFIGFSISIIAIVLWDISISFMIYKASTKRVFSISKDYLITQKGSIETTKKILALYKIQSVRFKQSIFMKNKGRASLKIYTASENISIPYISEDIARECYDYILYMIECENKKWM